MPGGMRNSERGDPWPPIRAWLCFQLVCGWFSLLGSSRAPELSMSVLGMFPPWSRVPALYLTAPWTCFMDSGFSILSKVGRIVGNIVLICLLLSSIAELTSNEWPESDHREIALEVFVCLFVCFGENIMPEMKLNRKTSDNSMPLTRVLPPGSQPDHFSVSDTKYHTFP